MGFFDDLTAAAKKGVSSLEKLADDAGKEWKHTIQPELKKQTKKAQKKVEEFAEYTRNEWERTLKPNLLKAHRDSMKYWNQLNSMVDATKDETKEVINRRLNKFQNSQLGRDLQKYSVVQRVTKKELKEVAEILKEMIGTASVAFTLIMFLTSWLPGIGIAVSGGVVVKALCQVADQYSKMADEERKKVGKVCSYIRGFFTII
ncbi:MAG: hypothetical protein LUE93_03200 [Bacteroides sp.]|nr:hypothetical protein [Bacteroides sp.]